jgi:hypothetical protein
MELTTEQYQLARVAYDAYVKQAGGVSLATGAKLPPFDELSQPIKDAWVAAAEAVTLDMFRVEFSGEFIKEPPSAIQPVEPRPESSGYSDIRDWTAVI